MNQAVVFDLGGVVCEFHPERRLRALSAATGLPAEQVHDAIWGSGLDERAELGDFTPSEASEAILDALGRCLDLVTLRVAWSQAFVPDESVCTLVRDVRTQRYAFTNNGPIVTDCLAHELESVGRLVDRVICSWEIRVRKPDPDAFHRLANELQRSPTEITFIDDAVMNCEAAASVGMQAIHFHDAPELERLLDQMHLLIA